MSYHCSSQNVEFQTIFSKSFEKSGPKTLPAVNVIKHFFFVNHGKIKLARLVFVPNLTRYKYSSIFCPSFLKNKVFYSIDTWWQCYKTVFLVGNCDIRVKSKILMMYKMKQNKISQIAKEVLA
jgi:hypothetical protein